MTLPRACRLSGSAAFKRVFDRRAKRDLGWMVVHGAANDLGITRLGLSIGVRVGKANKRVSLKRKLREAFRQCRCGLPLGMDIVVSARAHQERQTDEYLQALSQAASSLATQLGLP